MGSGVLLAALVVLWFVVLVPMVVTRGDSSAERSTGADAGRTLQRRRAVDPAVFAETERVSIDRGALRTSGELRVDVHAVLLALTLLALVGALVWTPWLWIAHGVLDVAVVAYLMVLRAVARRERLAARRAARAAARSVRQPAARPAARPVPAPRPAPAGGQPAGGGHSSVALPHPSLPLAPVHPLRPGRVVAARTAAPAGWQNSAVVGLDDDDIGFADIDVYQPRRVANG